MVTKFEEGEVYRNKELPRDIMVYGTGIENDEEVVLAIGWVDRESEEMVEPGEITIKKTDFGKWEATEHEE